MATGSPLAISEDAFGTDLYRSLAEHSKETVFSPVSVSAALRMVLCGARGETAAELAAALRLDLPPDSPAETLADRAADGLRSLSDLVDEVTATKSVTFRVANTVWVQSGLPLVPEFVERLRQASLEDADFAHAHEAARTEINRVIEEQTEGKITGLLAPGIVTSTTRLVLANAVYLKAPWANPFPESATSDAPFHADAPGGSGGTVTVPMMRGSATRAYLRAPGYQAVLLPYQRSRLAMAIVLPDGSLTGLGPMLAAGGLRGLLDGTSMYRVDLSIPRFRVEAKFDLIPALRQLGITRAFTQAADFTGMTTAAKLAIGAVVHKAYVDVDEHGTEAAAATAVIMRMLAATRAPERVEMVVDRPFLFAIIDTPTGTPLFLGQVSNPRHSR